MGHKSGFESLAAHHRALWSLAGVFVAVIVTLMVTVGALCGDLGQHVNNELLVTTQVIGTQ